MAPKKLRERLAPAPLGSGNERLRFVLKARVDSASITQTELSRRVGRNLSSLILHRSDLLDQSLLPTFEQIDDLIQSDRAISRFARRMVEAGSPQRREVLADPRWWSELRNSNPSNPVEVIVTGHALAAAQQAGVLGRGSIERIGRRRVTFGLCRVASGNSPHADEATSLLGQIAPRVRDEVAYFMQRSPLGAEVARSADLALRMYPSDGGLRAALLEVITETPLDIHTPSPLYHPLVLRRRLLLDSLQAGDVSAAQRLTTEFSELALNRHAPARWRRFAVWLVAELTKLQSGVDRLLTARDAERLLAQLSGDAAVADVVRALGGHEQWTLPNNDLVRLDTRSGDEDQRFEWPHSGSDRHWLDSFVGQLAGGQTRPGRWRKSVTTGLEARLQDDVHEAVTHPGLVRVRLALEMFNAAGPRISSTLAVSIVEDLIRYPGFGNPSTGCVDNALYLVGRLAQDPTSDERRRVSEWLAKYANEFDSGELRASALWSLGNKADDGGDPSVQAAITTALSDEDVRVRRAALRTAGVLGATRLQARIERVMMHDSDRPTRSWARWAQMVWDPRSVNAPPLAL